MASEGTISNLRKRRGAQCRYFNKLAEKVGDLGENFSKEDTAVVHAKLLLDPLDWLDTEYWSLNLKVIDFFDKEDESTLQNEQEHPDKLNDDVTTLRLHLKPLIAVTPSTDVTSSTAACKTLSRKLSHLEKSLCASDDHKALGASPCWNALWEVGRHQEGSHHSSRWTWTWMALMACSLGTL